MSVWPEQKDDTDDTRRATAPYNFVPLPRKVYEVDGGIDVTDHGKLMPWTTHNQWLAGTYSGWIDLELETLTPLYIRDFARENGQGYWDARESRLRPDPSRTPEGHSTLPDPTKTPDGRPLIPGSSLRGMTRTLVEILSFSKVAPVTTNQPFFRTFNKDRVGDAYGKRMVRGDQKPEGGFLRSREGGWLIERCPFYRVRRALLLAKGVQLPWNADDKPPWGFQQQACHVLLPLKGRFVDDIRFGTSSPGSDWAPATLVITGSSPHSRSEEHPKSEFVFLSPTPGAAPIPVPNRVWERFHDDDQITQWQEKAFPRDKPSGVRRQKAGWLRDGEPVFYLCDAQAAQEDNPTGLLFLGRAQMFRFPYDVSPYDLIPDNVRMAKLDLAEAMFGQVARERGSTAPPIKGRVRFEDAVAIDGQRDMYEQLLVPRVLSSPKPTTYPHYLVQDGTKPAKELATYLEEDRERTAIRGHKLYWHRWGSREIEDVKEQPSQLQKRLLEDLQAILPKEPDDRQHTIIRPVRKGVQFTGRIRFENLTPLELGALLTALRLPDECAHKLGMAKPLGLGSARITPTLHVIDRAQRYAAWTGDGSSVDDGAIYLKTFADEMLRFANDSQEPRFAGDRGIWQIARLAALYLLLRLEGGPGFETTAPMVLESGRNDFRARKVLPTPFGADPNRPPWQREPAVAARLPRSGETVTWVVREEQSKGGKQQFQLQGGDIIGVLHPRSAQPPDVTPGQPLRLRVSGTSTGKSGWNLTWDDPNALQPKPPARKGGPPTRGHGK